MPVVSVPTSFNINLEFDAPGLGKRAASLFIDMLVQYLYIMLISYIIGQLHLNLSGFNNWALWLILMSPVFLYHIILETTTNGQSIGKKLMKLRVVSINGGRASLSQLLIRWLLRVSDLWIVILIALLIYMMVGGGGGTETIFAVLFGISFLLADILLVSNSNKPQRVGDILAQTIIIKTSVKENLEHTVFREVEDDYQPAFPQVMRISDKDLNVIKTLLNNSKGSKHHEELAIAAEKVKAYLNIKTDMYPDQFLERLLKDYNYLSAQ